MGRRLLRSLVAVVVLAASLVWPATMTAGAWSSDDWAVAVFGGSGSDYGHSVAVGISGCRTGAYGRFGDVVGA